MDRHAGQVRQELCQLRVPLAAVMPPSVHNGCTTWQDDGTVKTIEYQITPPGGPPCPLHHACGFISLEKPQFDFFFPFCMVPFAVTSLRYLAGIYGSSGFAFPWKLYRLRTVKWGSPSFLFNGIEGEAPPNTPSGL